MPLTKTGTCAWCGKHDARLIYTSRIINGQYSADYVCEKCREVIRLGTTMREDERHG